MGFNVDQFPGSPNRFGASRRKQQIMGKGPPQNLGKANGTGAGTKA